MEVSFPPILVPLRLHSAELWIKKLMGGTALAFRRPKKNKNKKYKITFMIFNFLIFDLWTLELAIFDLKIGFPVKFPPRGLILRSQFWNLGPEIPPKKNGRKASAGNTLSGEGRF